MVHHHPTRAQNLALHCHQNGSQFPSLYSQTYQKSRVRRGHDNVQGLLLQLDGLLAPQLANQVVLVVFAFHLDHRSLLQCRSPPLLELV